MDVENYESQQHPFTILDLVAILWRFKILFVIIIIFGLVTGVVYSLQVPNMYKSDAILSPNNSDASHGLSGLSSQFGNLASFAGIDVGGGNNSVLATLEMLKSRQFIISFIQRHELKPLLLAVKNVSKQKKSYAIEFDGDVFDGEKWLIDKDSNESFEPSDLEAFNEFISLLTLSYSSDNNVVSISMEHQSPEIAEEWLELLIVDINEYIKTRDAAESRRAIFYLKEQIDKTRLVGSKNMLFELLEEQEKKLMFTQIRNEYALRTIDPPLEPEKKFKPKRVLIVLIFLFTFTFLALFICLFVNWLKMIRQNRS